MTDRLAALNRIRSVQRHIKRMADWRLADAEREAIEAAEARAAIDAYIEEVAPTGALADMAVRQARRSGERGQHAAAAVSAAATAARDAGAREKLVERRVGEVAREERTMRERRDLERLIENFAARGTQTE